VAGSFEHGNDPWGSVKGGEFRDYEILKDSAPLSWLSSCYLVFFTLKKFT